MAEPTGIPDSKADSDALSLQGIDVGVQQLEAPYRRLPDHLSERKEQGNRRYISSLAQ